MVGGWGRGHTTDSFLVEDTEIFTVGIGTCSGNVH